MAGIAQSTHAEEFFLTRTFADGDTAPGLQPVVGHDGAFGVATLVVRKNLIRARCA
jgi:hypothetical protein